MKTRGKATGKTGSRAHRKKGLPRSRKSVGNTILGNILEKDFREFVESLNVHGVEYLVVGGYAVALHGQSRYTKNLDIWVKRNKKNAERLTKALGAFGVASLGYTRDDFLDSNTFVQIGVAPWRIDIITDLIGVTFNECYKRKVVIDLDGVKVKFIDLDSLLKNKRSSGRHKDLADVEDLGG